MAHVLEVVRRVDQIGPRLDELADRGWDVKRVEGKATRGEDVRRLAGGYRGFSKWLRGFHFDEIVGLENVEDRHDADVLRASCRLERGER